MAGLREGSGRGGVVEMAGRGGVGAGGWGLGVVTEGGGGGGATDGSSTDMWGWEEHVSSRELATQELYESWYRRDKCATNSHLSLM